MALVLASRSPRRRVLLGRLLPQFEVHVINTEEVAPRALAIEDAVQVIARRKALAVSAERPGQWVLAADTVLSYHGELLDKAHTEGEARLRLATLAGTTHRVTTGLALAFDERAVDDDVAVTAVHMERIPPSILNTYIADGLWHGKAGGYGIQDPILRPFLKVQSGPWSNVVGLPLAMTAQLLRRNGIFCADAPDEDWLQNNYPFDGDG